MNIAVGEATVPELKFSGHQKLVFFFLQFWTSTISIEGTR